MPHPHASYKTQIYYKAHTIYVKKMSHQRTRAHVFRRVCVQCMHNHAARHVAAAPLLHHNLAGPLPLGAARPLPCKLRVAQTTSGPKTGSYSYLVGWPLHFIACVIQQGASPRHIWNNHFALHSTKQ